MTSFILTTADRGRSFGCYAGPAADGHARMRLLPSGDGWSLVGTDGRVVFSALGLGGRRHCLEFARAHGVAALSS